MNSKKNSFKRVAASALAVLTVAAYAAPVANVGGLPSVNVLTADAAANNNINWTTAKQYLTKFTQDAEGTENDVNYTSGLSGFQGYSAVTGAAITLESKVPLAITCATFDTTGTDIAGYTYSDTSAGFYANGSTEYSRNNLKFTVSGVDYYGYYSGGYTNVSAETEIRGKYVYKDSTNKYAEATRLDQVKFYIDNAGYVNTVDFTSVADTDATSKVVSVGTKYSLRVSDEDVKKATIAQAEGVTDAEYADIIAAATFDGTHAKVIKNLVVKEKTSSGKFTYTFTMPDAEVTVATTKQDAEYKVFDKEADRTTGTLSTKGKIADLTIKDNTTAVTKLVDDKNGNTPALVIGDTVTIEATEAFAVHVNDKNDKNAWTNPVTSFANGKFAATFTMPKVAEGQTKVEIQVVRVDEEYSYSVSTGKLLASTKSGSIKDAQAALITVKSYKPDEAAAIDITAAEPKKGTDVASNGKAANGNTVAVYPQFAAQLLKDLDVPTLKVTKDDVAVVDPKNGTPTNNYIIDGAANGVAYDANGYYTFTKAGTYAVTYTVTGRDNKSYDVTYTFIIAAKDELVAEDFTFTISTKKDGKDQTANETAAIIKGGAGSLTQTGVTGKVVSYMLAEDQAEDVKKSNYQFTITPASDKIANTAGENDKFEISGYPSGSKLDNKYTFTISIYDSEYGGSKKNPKTIDVDWIIKDYVEDPLFTNVKTGVPKEDVSSVKETIFELAAENSTAKALADEVSYEYVVGVGANRTGEEEDELDEFIPGVPSEIGTYTVYIKYDNKVVSTVDLTISSYGLSIIGTNADDFSLTYSDLFNLSKYKLVDKDGKKVTAVTVSDINATIKTKAVLNEDGTVKTPSAVVNGYTADDIANKAGLNPVASKALANVPLEDLKEVYIPAGEYIIQFSGTSSDPSKYSVSATRGYQDLTVAPKKLSDKTFKVVIEPIVYDGKTHDIVKEGEFRAYDAVTGEDLSNDVKITEGPKSSAINKYSATVMLKSKKANYEGSGEFEWAIACKENKNIQAGLEWDEKRTTLYNNGYIHTEFKRNANDKITLNGATQKIKQFGVVYENEGLLKAPSTEYGKAFNATELQAAEEYLQLGNAKAGKYDNTSTKVKADDTQIYSNQIAVKNVEIGVWVRPYLQIEDGSVVYGEVKYLDLTKEAIEKLQLQMPIENTVSTGATAGKRKADLTAAQAKEPLKNVKSGYIPEKDRFYAYAQFIDLETAGFSDVLQVSDFGVVLDNKGIIASNANAKDIDDQLRIGKNKNYVVGHYDPANKVLKTNEYAATIKAKNSATGVWVRPYLDLGNGLVIYGEAKYIASASTFYTNGATVGAGTLTTKWTDNTKTKLQFTVSAADTNKADIAAKSGVDASKIKVVQTGVVLDKKGLITAEDDVNTKLILNGGFIQGGKDNEFNKTYIGKATPVSGKDIFARAYVTYSIDGNEVTVYGPITRGIYNETSGRVVANVTVNAGVTTITEFDVV